ncbi:MAG: hypothetical protein WCL50_13300 [Spirochaetota bacterium]
MRRSRTSSHRELLVEPRKFHGRLIHSLPEARCPQGEVCVELYFAEPSQSNHIGLYKQGTRVIPDLSILAKVAPLAWPQVLPPGRLGWIDISTGASGLHLPKGSG